MITRVLRLKDELSEVYANLIIQTFAISLAGVFLPIFVINLGHSLDIALMFMLVFWIAHGIFVPFASKLSGVIGLKHSILIRIPLLVSFFALLAWAPGIANNLSVLFFIAILGGISEAIYWPSLHAVFIKNSSLVGETAQAGNLFAFPKFAAVVAPLLGATILAVLGFPVLFAIVIVLMLLSVVPLFVTPDRRESVTIDKKVFSSSSVYALLFLSKGILKVSEAVMWPLFVFVMIGGFVNVGLAATFTALGIAIFTSFISKITKKMRRHQLLKIGAIGYLVIWVLRIGATSIEEVILLSFFGGIFFSIISVLVYTFFADRARGVHMMREVAFREIWLMFGMALPILFALMFLEPATKFVFVFSLAAIISLLFVFI